MQEINLQKIKLVETLVNLFDLKMKYQISFINQKLFNLGNTGLTMIEFEACKSVAEDLYMKEVSNNEN